MKTALEVLLEYAAAFEETYADDNWERLAPYFAQDAVYEVRGGPLACTIEGPTAIFAGLKKSLDGLDRKCDKRKIDVLSAPQINTTGEGEEVSLEWRVRYTYGELPESGFAGRSLALINNGVITSLRDEYADTELDSFEAWVRDNDVPVDGAYV
ncbi:MAG: nuclear transport factor 2 family protein [Halioglobus sp.]